MLLHLLYWKWTLPITRPHGVIHSPVSVKRWFTFWTVKAQWKNGTGVHLSWLLRFCTFEFSKYLTSLSAGSFMVLPPEHAPYSWFLLTYVSGWTLSYVADDAECLWKQTCFSCMLSTSFRTFLCNMIEIRNHSFNIIIQVSLIQLHDRVKPQGVVSPGMFLKTELFCYLVLCVNVCVCVCVCVCAQSCPTLCDPMDSSPPDSSVRGIFQARILGCHFLLQGIFLTQGSNPSLLHLLHWQWIPVVLPGKPNLML